jgi:hypothetical protein
MKVQTGASLHWFVAPHPFVSDAAHILCPERRRASKVRKFLITALVAGSMGVTGLLALPAHATSVCPTGPTVTQGAGASGTVTVGTPAGCATVSGDATTQKGYVVADGVATNPSALSGYIGVDGSDGGPTIVGCGNGDYTPGAGNQYSTPPGPNHVIASQAHPPSAPSPTDPCTPKAP